MDNNIKYRSKLCYHYIRGNCKLGEKCQFAHGTKFLRKKKNIISNKSSEYCEVCKIDESSNYLILDHCTNR